MKVLTDVQNCNVRFTTLEVQAEDVGKVLHKLDSTKDYCIKTPDIGKVVSRLSFNGEVRSTVFVEEELF